MVTVNINMEQYSKIVREVTDNILADKYHDKAKQMLQTGESPANVAEQLYSDVVRSVKAGMFRYLKSHHHLSKKYKTLLYPGSSIIRRIPLEPSTTDIPRRYFDIESFVPELHQLISDLVLEANKDIMISKIMEAGAIANAANATI